MKQPCSKCGVEIDYEPEYCCDGYMCGCMGLPRYPDWCADCWDRIVNKRNKKDTE